MKLPDKDSKTIINIFLFIWLIWERERETNSFFLFSLLIFDMRSIGGVTFHFSF